MAGGSVLAMTFMLPLDLVDVAERPMQESVEAAAAGSGTPFISHYTPDAMSEICRAAGFSEVQHVSPDDLTARYFAGRADGLRPPSAEHLIVRRSRRRLSGYPGPVSSQRVPGGVVHKLPADLRKALIGNATALAAWKDITPLARNEFICWVEDAKQEKTRERRIRRTQEELEEGMRRPCCWPGCKHRERNG